MNKHPAKGAFQRARALRNDMTDAEKRISDILRSRRLVGHKFRRQVPLDRYIADFVCHEARLIIEIDGGQHDPSSDGELERSRFLSGEGYLILRFWNNDVVANPEGVHSRIVETLQRVHPHPNPLPSRERA